MKKNKTGLAASGKTQPEIRPGDVWKDRGGSKIKITDFAHNRVMYHREGYENPCICSPDRLRREFVKVKNENIPAWCREKNLEEKTKKLRELIQAGKSKK